MLADEVLRAESLLDTLKRGVTEGILALRRPRPDGSAQTWRRIPPNEDILLRPEIEILPANAAVLSNLEVELLKPGQLDACGLHREKACDWTPYAPISMANAPLRRLTRP